MPTQTTDTKPDNDTQHNPGAEQAENLFNKHGVLSQAEVDARRQSYTGNGQGDAAVGEKKAIGDTATGKAAVDTAAAAASTVGSAVAGQLVKFIGKINTKKGGVGAIVIGVIIAGIIMISGFLGPGLLIVQVKEAFMSKFSDTVSAIDDRQTLIVKKKLQNATAGCDGLIKVKCRFKGMSERQIKKLERTGITVNRGEKIPLTNRVRVVSLVTPDPGSTEVTARNYDSKASNPVVRGHLLRALSPKYVTYTSKAFNSFMKKYGMDKRKKITGTTSEEVEKSFANTMDGVDEDGKPLGRTTVKKDSEGNFVNEQTGEPATDSNGNALTQAQADEINRAGAEYNKIITDISKGGKRAFLNIAKSQALATITPVLGAIDTLCTAYYINLTVANGAKILAAKDLIILGFALDNLADSIKAGDATAAEVAYVGHLMTKLNQYGQSFTDSFGYKYAAHGSLALPIGKTKEETNLRRGSIFQYSVGGGVAGKMQDFSNLLNQVTNNTPKERCRDIKHPASQVGLLVGGLALTAGTGGGNIIAGGATALLVNVAVSSVIAIAIPTLQNMVAGKTVPKDIFGPEMGDGDTSAHGVMNAQIGQAHALSPLTIAQFLTYQKTSQETLANIKAAERTVSNPFDVYDTSTAAYTVASTLNTYIAPKNIASIISTPLSAISAGASSIFSSSVKAASDPRAEFEICTDEAYNEAGYAADPFCNIRYGLSPEELSLDPEVVDNYMYDNQHIDGNGAPISAEFTKYINSCINRSLPLGATNESGGDDGTECNKPGEGGRNNYFRIYYLDTVINDEFDDEDTLGLDTVAAPDTTTPNPGSLIPANGDDQSLAKQIIDSGKISGDSRAMQQIRNYAEGNFSCHINRDILVLIATAAKTHTLSVSSLNRYCIGVLTDSGPSSYHYRDGGGHAVDFNWVDGVHASGSTATDLAFLREIIPILPPNSGIGQSDCRSGSSRLILPAGFRTFPDTCNHNHIEVPVK